MSKNLIARLLRTDQHFLSNRFTGHTPIFVLKVTICLNDDQVLLQTHKMTNLLAGIDRDLIVHQSGKINCAKSWVT